jgi:hypothetical protein
MFQSVFKAPFGWTSSGSGTVARYGVAEAAPETLLPGSICLVGKKYEDTELFCWCHSAAQ